MLALSVSINGHHKCNAGIDGPGVLSAILSSTLHRNPRDDNALLPRRTTLRIGGLASGSDSHLRWLVETLGPGDRIEILVHEADAVDQPTTEEARSNTDPWSRSATISVVRRAGYSPQVLPFIRYVLAHIPEIQAGTVERMDAARADPPNPQLLCDSIIRYGRHHLRERLQVWFHEWGIGTSEQLGQLIELLVAHGLVKPGPGLDASDFAGLYTREDLDP